MIGFYNYTVILTYLSVVSAVIGISLAIQGFVFGAIPCLMVSGFCDMLDGTVAKTKEQNDMEKKFGIQIDALADLISFGVFPALIGYTLGLDRPIHLLILMVYILAALIRLAYYNVTEEMNLQTQETRSHYDGLPVTSVAIIIPLFWCFRSSLNSYFPAAYGVLLFCLAAAFVSKIKVKKANLKGRLVMAFVGVLILSYLTAGGWKFGIY